MHLRSTACRRRLPAAVALVLLAGAVAGCGPDYKNRGVVKGKVTMGKTALPSGTVVFHGPNNLQSTAMIDENGNYTMLDAPVGEVTITVTVPTLPQVQGGMKAEVERRKKIAGGNSADPSGESSGIMFSKMPTRAVRIEDKYSKPETSPLKFEVQKGEQTKDIEL
jgi:hypothetical protein